MAAEPLPACMRTSGYSAWQTVVGHYLLHERGLVKTTVIVTDVLVRFRMFAIAQSDRQTQAWEMQVMVIQQVTDILISLGFLDSKAAALLTEASTTITPQPGITTVPFSDFAALTELVYSDSEPVSLEAQQGHVLVARGETTEEALACAGFALKVNGPLQ